MDLNIYQIILGRIISDKAYRLNQSMNKLVLRVHPAANKSMIAEAIEKLFAVKVKSVRTLVRKGKNKVVKRRTVTDSTSKKAIVTLAEGYSVDLFNQADTKLAPQGTGKGV